MFCVTLIWLVSAEVSGRPLSSDIDKLTADEMAPLALEDSMYYHFAEWFARFQAEINRLESATPSKENRVELMKFYFNYAGLLGELTHTLAFTSKYQDTKIAADFIFYSNRVKGLAHEVLDDDTKSIQQEAEADLFLGAAEGYIGIFEYGQGNLLQALVNGFQADNHLEKALQLNPNLVDGYFGLGMYRYGNSRLGGVSNFIMQGGKDLRQLGLNHIELAILKKTSSLPLALKTLAWFYISEQINPENKELPPEHPLSQGKTRQKAWALLIELENRYFKGSAPHSHFKGNKEIAMMKALQYALDKDYTNAGSEFEKILTISQHLKKRGFKVNPQLISSVEAGIKFCNLMLWKKQDNRNCLKIQEQIDFLKSGGSMVEYDSKKIRSELHAVFLEALQELTQKMNCGVVSATTNSEPF
jgi:tetratricopeptide (TPR) repeat protein